MFFRHPANEICFLCLFQFQFRRLAVVLLNAADFHASHFVDRFQPLDGGVESFYRGRDGHSFDDRMRPHLDLVGARRGAGGRGVDDPFEFMVVDGVNDVRAAFANLEDRLNLESGVIDLEHGHF